MSKLFILTAFVASTLLSACHSSSPARKTAAMASTGQYEQLKGTWELDYVSGAAGAFSDLYPDKKPAITFDLNQKRISGNTGCNSFSGPLKTDASHIDFNSPMMMTRMFCAGGGEQVFLDALHKVTSFSITGNNTLNLISGDIALMRFVRK